MRSHLSHRVFLASLPLLAGLLDCVTPLPKSRHRAIMFSRLAVYLEAMPSERIERVEGLAAAAL